MINDLMQFTLFVLILIALVVPMGMWLARTFSSPSHARLERLTYTSALIPRRGCRGTAMAWPYFYPMLP
jgi:hypothetical protein